MILDNGSAAICDFGQSRIIEEKGYTTKLLVSAKYVAQEILMDESNGDDPDYEDPISGTSKMTSPEGDVYSYAMTALEACCLNVIFSCACSPQSGVSQVASGVAPFKRYKRDVMVIQKVCAGSRPERKDHDNIPDALWNLFARAWDKNPKDRPTMANVLNELSSMRSP